MTPGFITIFCLACRAKLKSTTGWIRLCVWCIYLLLTITTQYQIERIIKVLLFTKAMYNLTFTSHLTLPLTAVDTYRRQWTGSATRTMTYHDTSLRIWLQSCALWRQAVQRQGVCLALRSRAFRFAVTSHGCHSTSAAQASRCAVRLNWYKLIINCIFKYAMYWRPSCYFATFIQKATWKICRNQAQAISFRTIYDIWWFWMSIEMYVDKMVYIVLLHETSA